MKPKREAGKRRRLLAASGIALVSAVLLVYALRHPILRGLGDFLVVRDDPSQADVIFLLNGDPNTRPFEAARLFRQGLASQVLIARAEDSPLSRAGVVPNTTDLCIEALKKTGVPNDRIVQIRPPVRVTSTFDEARALNEYVSANRIRRVIVVTSSFHTRRARWIIGRQIQGTGATLLMWPVEDPKYGPSNWWTKEDGLIGLQNEYVKLLYYAVFH
jgi:uncharacterized SAM-binding protein YcdF (DUF218 family)